MDPYTKNDTSFVNIIDYKSSEGSATLDLTKVYYGPANANDDIHGYRFTK